MMRASFVDDALTSAPREVCNILWIMNARIWQDSWKRRQGMPLPAKSGRYWDGLWPYGMLT